MRAAAPTRHHFALGFGLLLLSIIGVALLVVQQPDFTLRPALPAAAVSFDVLVLPGLFYLLIVRPYRLPASTVAATLFL